MACVALPRVVNQRGGDDAAAQGEAHRCSRLRPRLARRHVHFHSVAMARRAARSWHVWRSGERRGAAVGDVALAPMRPRRVRCTIASSSGRAWRGGTCTGAQGLIPNSCRWRT